MLPFYKNPGQLMRKITLATLVFTVCIGAVLVLVQIKPFWVDEWFIIDSLKTKDVTGIFGQLDFMQQFPRVYLALIKVFTSFFNYSYFSLRLPSYLVSVSSFTYTEYFVEMKQYPMDIFMSVAALWQLSELLQLKEDNAVNISRYVFLCAGFLIVPFFSYTYLIAIAPAYFVIFLQTISILKSDRPGAVKRRILVMQWGAILISVSGVFLFYLLDAKQLATDKIMYDRWSFLIINEGNKLYSFFTSFYTLFSQTGNGLVFESLFGILGIGGFIFGIVSCIKGYLKREESLEMQMRTSGWRRIKRYLYLLQPA